MIFSIPSAHHDGKGLPQATSVLKTFCNADVDELNVHAPIPAGQSGLALVNPARPGVYTFYCAPHYDKASSEGMKGTLIVE
jgi:plastocyanin